jgi:hypothetical protein
MTGGNLHQKLLWLLLIAAVLAACSPAGGNPGAGDEITVTEPVDVGEEKDEDGEAATEDVQATTIAEAVETAISAETAAVSAITATAEAVSAAETATASAVEPDFVVTAFSWIYPDGLGDCSFSDGTPTDCAGLDIESVMMGSVADEAELEGFNLEAVLEGFVPLEAPITGEFPLIIVAIRFDEFDPLEGFFCVDWGDPPSGTVPTDPDAIVEATCLNPEFEFLYINIVDESGQEGVEADPDSTSVSMDPNIGITFGQERKSIIEVFPGQSLGIGIGAFANEVSRFDHLRIAPEIIFVE